MYLGASSTYLDVSEVLHVIHIMQIALRYMLFFIESDDPDAKA